MGDRPATATDDQWSKLVARHGRESGWLAVWVRVSLDIRQHHVFVHGRRRIAALARALARA